MRLVAAVAKGESRLARTSTDVLHPSNKSSLLVRTSAGGLRPNKNGPWPFGLDAKAKSVEANHLQSVPCEIAFPVRVVQAGFLFLSILPTTLSPISLPSDAFSSSRAELARRSTGVAPLKRPHGGAETTPGGRENGGGSPEEATRWGQDITWWARQQRSAVAAAVAGAVAAAAAVEGAGHSDSVS